MPSDTDPTTQASIVLASFENRHAAERWLASIGRDVRRQARTGHVEAFVISGSKDGSLKLTESRVLTTTGVAALIPHLGASIMLGFIGIRSMLRGAKIEGPALLKRAPHVGSNAHKAHAILAQAGPNAAVVMVSCDQRETRQTLAAQAGQHATMIWDGSRAELRSGPEPGSTHYWVRAALGEASPAHA
jgi:hypothetical protein